MIDPILSCSSFLGGSAHEIGMDVAVDRDGNAYLTGATTSANFATESSLGEGFVGGGLFGSDGFVTKINPEGTDLIYSTYFGGNGDEIGLGVVADSFGRVFVAGATSSADFPTAAAIQADFGGGGENYGTDAFVLKLDATGSELIFPTERPMQAGNAGGGLFASDAFVAQLSSEGMLVYSTYLGGAEDEAGTGIAADGDGNAYVTGLTYSDDFPLMDPLQDTRAGVADAFVAKLNPDGNALLYSTYLGGQSDDFGLAIDIDSEGSAYLTGLTGSSDGFPLVDAAQENFGSEDGAGFDAFVTKVSADRSELVYSTYLGGSEAETGFGIAVDRDGNAYVSGETASPDFPTMNAIQSFNGGLTDGFVAKLNPTGSTFEYCSCFGGSGFDSTSAVAVDSEGGAYVAGSSLSSNAPATFGAFQTDTAGGADALVLKIIEDEARRVTTVSAASFVGGGALAPASIASGFGTDLATATEVATTLPLPTSLAGTTVGVTDSGGTDRPAELFFVSPGQINYLIPEATKTGLALITVSVDGQLVAEGTVRVESVAPSLFTANATGEGVAAASYLRVAADGTRTQELIFDPNTRAAVPIDLGPEGDQFFLLLFGTGIRGFRSEVTATVGGEEVPVLGAVPQGEFVGLDQVNLGPLPRSLLGRGEVEIILTVDGKTANTVTLNIR